MARIRKSENGADTAARRIIWRIAVYIRLSKEDGNDESLSVTNQKKIICEYLEHFFDEEYTVEAFYVDDGLTGTDYNRPAFQQMIHDMEDGKVNCIVCKNLSRMFRNYSDQGYFLEKVFPMNKTRFITVSDPKIDSYLRPEAMEGLEVPISGLMNDRFAAKTSHDIRDTFAMKRRKGEFIGAFAPYGYQKDPNDKNHLVIDEEAAPVVRDIFEWFVHGGMSKNGIARRLNEEGILNPTSYKHSRGMKYHNPQIDINDGLWSSSAITGILKNRMYIGTMVQGRQTVISYKVHDKAAVPEEDWYVVENTHEPVIDRDIFQKAQILQQRDTRTAPEKWELHLLAGFIRCADCRKAMTRQKSKNTVYYYCRTYRDKSKSLCTKHAIREEQVTEVILTVIQKQIELIPNLTETAEAIRTAPAAQNESTRLAAMMRLRRTDLDKVTGVKDCLYADWKNGDISRDEYKRLKSRYTAQEKELRQMIENMQQKYDGMAGESVTADPYLAAFLEDRNIESLQRGILVDLVKNIFVHDGGEIEIEFNFADQHRKYLVFAERYNSMIKS